MLEVEPKYFRKFEERIIKKIDTSINELAVMIKDNFATKTDLQDGLNSIKDEMVTKKDFEYEIGLIRNEMATKKDLEYEVGSIRFEINLIRNEMATKNDVDKILKHIGRYEVRAQNTEEMLIEDHKPRINALERSVFAL